MNNTNNPTGRFSETMLMPVTGRKSTYTYTMRGQPKRTDTPGFAQTLYYEDNATIPCYNGNISAAGFGYELDAASGSIWELDKVTYEYDRLNRLKASYSSDGYDTLYEYDLNSAPQLIVRHGKTSDGSIGVVDEMFMDYDGNRLSHIMDAAERVVLESSLDFDSETGEAYYDYDSDGRLISDTGTGIEHISYAPNDMPVKIKRASGQIAYTYRADGTKVSRTVVTEGRGRPIARNHYYVGPFQFTNNSTFHTIQLERINLPWGYFDDKLTPMVNLTDYQGNIRAVFSQYHGLTMQTTDFYPYGLPKATSTNPTVNAYKYGGKELSTDFGIDLYDFEARLQFPSQLRFNRPDPKSWDYPDTNPYLYCAANPIMLTDPTGCEVDSIWENNEPVISPSLFVGWGADPFYSSFVAKNKRDPNCADYAKEQLRVAGYTVGGGSDPSNLYPYDETTGVNEEDTEATIEIITKSIENGVPLMAGVDSMPGKNINEGTTDHFLTIVGIGNDEKGNFVQVFDNATSSEIFGTSKDNKLYYNPESKTFTGQTRLKENMISKVFTISQIRISYPIK